MARYDRPLPTTRDPFRSGASVYIADSKRGMGFVARYAAQAASDYFVASMKQKLSRQPERTGTEYHHPRFGTYKASRPGEGVEGEYPAWYTGRLQASIKKEVVREGGVSEYHVGSAEPHAYWLMKGWTSENAEAAPRPFLLRNAIEELDTIEKILAHPFRNIGKKPKKVSARMTREEVFRIMQDGTDYYTQRRPLEMDKSLIAEFLDDNPTAPFSKTLKVTVQEYYK